MSVAHSDGHEVLSFVVVIVVAAAASIFVDRGETAPRLLLLTNTCAFTIGTPPTCRSKQRQQRPPPHYPHHPRRWRPLIVSSKQSLSLSMYSSLNVFVSVWLDVTAAGPARLSDSRELRHGRAADAE
jgi:hypothetical protein